MKALIIMSLLLMFCSCVNDRPCELSIKKEEHLDFDELYKLLNLYNPFTASKYNLIEKKSSPINETSKLFDLSNKEIVSVSEDSLNKARKIKLRSKNETLNYFEKVKGDTVFFYIEENQFIWSGLYSRNRNYVILVEIPDFTRGVINPKVINQIIISDDKFNVFFVFGMYERYIKSLTKYCYRDKLFFNKFFDDNKVYNQKKSKEFLMLSEFKSYIDKYSNSNLSNKKDINSDSKFDLLSAVRN